MKNIFLLFTFLLTTTYAIAQWVPTTDTDINYLSIAIDAVDDQICWVGGINLNGPSSILKTTDGGNTWTSFSYPNAATDWQSTICAIDENTAFFGGWPNNGPAHVMRTQDGGITWEVMDLGNTTNLSIISGIHFYDAMEGFVLTVSGNRYLLFKTFDGGDNWTQASSLLTLLLDFNYLYNSTSNYAVVDDHIWFGTLSGKIFHSSDRGETWSFTNFPVNDATSISFRDTQNGICVSSGNSTGIGMNGDTQKRVGYRTADGGTTWEEIAIPNDIETVEYVPGSNGVYIGTQSFTGKAFYYISMDNGDTWKEQNAGNIFDVDFISPDTGWATGMVEGSNIAKWGTTPLNETNVQEVVNDVPYHEDFENGHPDCYEFGGYTNLSSTFGTAENWEQNSGVTHDSHFAGVASASNLWWTYTHIQTAAIQLVEGNNHMLSFNAYFENSDVNGLDESATVSISTDDKQTWTEIYNLEALASTDWTIHEIDLSDYAGEKIYLSFNYTDLSYSIQSIANVGFFIDDIDISSLVSTENITATSSIKLFPNPAQDFITVELPNEDNDAILKILDTSGKIIRTIRGNIHQKISIADLPSGTYIVEYKNDDQILTGKFTKQ